MAELFLLEMAPLKWKFMRRRDHDAMVNALSEHIERISIIDNERRAVMRERDQALDKLRSLEARTARQLQQYRDEIDQIATAAPVEDVSAESIEVLPSEPAKPLSSAKRGQLGEDFVEKVLKKYFENVVNTSKSKESGDFIIDERIMVEVKNYGKTVPTIEVDKFRRDLGRRKLRVGVFISLNSKISKISSWQLHAIDGRVELFVITCDPREIRRAVRFADNICVHSPE